MFSIQNAIFVKQISSKYTNLNEFDLCLNIFEYVGRRYSQYFLFLEWGPASPSEQSVGSRIVGGEDTSVLDIPYQISLRLQDYHFCGGAIISAIYIVTAAHCIDVFAYRSPEDLSIRAGSTFRSFGGQVIPVKKIHQHPLFHKRKIDYDLSILELSSPLSINQYTKPIKLPHEGQKFYDGDLVHVSGWGVTREGHSSTAPETLQMTYLTLLDHKICEKKYGRDFTPRMVCAISKGGRRDSCHGDSGGPLVAKNVLVGVVSWGVGCALPSTPGIYTNVPALRHFIRKITGM
ncbi:Trypsin domain containing protein [Asbolus verrucosus]|uniref:Trypsin domain containing protein n=1 Tax=Asbolus verrucosus TaxID=1661398 RepID=A0A482W5L3_ASBVE|nr:Trypsin domain containing protein [Asbolus verrucosus]